MPDFALTGAKLGTKNLVCSHSGDIEDRIAQKKVEFHLYLHYAFDGGMSMMIDTNAIATATEAYQHFSRVARIADTNGQAVIFKNNKPK